ncbi:MAG TPA: Spy/CpxP family protein refolding chaperone [Stellaceae bacterium]|nr:Spy/CpxP family protein refolding chaperone [Stellaceae bacterium]
MTASRTLFTIAAAASIGSGLAWSPLAASSAWAQSNTAAPPAGSAAPSSSASTGTQAVKPRSDAQVEARITQLHKQLKITKDQESDWNTVAQDMRDNARAMSTDLSARNNSKTMNAADNLKSYAKIADTYADGLKKIAPDFATLYDKMSPAQKKIADQAFNHRINQKVKSTAAPSSPSHS